MDTIEWSRILGRNTWEHLKSLTLHNMDMPKKDFPEFLKRHAGTLKTLHLKDAYLIDSGSWVRILYDLKSFLPLERCGISGTFKSDAAEREHIGGELDDFVFEWETDLNMDVAYPMRRNSPSTGRPLGLRIAKWLTKDQPCPFLKKKSQVTV